MSLSFNKKGWAHKISAHPSILPNLFPLLQILFKTREFNPIKLTSFDPDEDHILFAQSIMIG
jgi:hypothetical protein